jgi:hypothetical protein
VEDCNCQKYNIKDYSKPSFTVLSKNLSSINLKIYGDMFNYKTLNGLYLSSSNMLMSSIKLDLYSNVKSISARYPSVSAFPIYDYDVIENYILEFKLPQNLLEGNYDILYFNDAGYYKASNSKKFTYFEVIN